MPELPEVETVRRGLFRLLRGKTVKSVRVFESPKSFPNDAASVEQFLYGAKVIDVRRRAKVLLIDLSTEYTLVIHLKMTGQLVWVRCVECIKDQTQVNLRRDDEAIISLQSAELGSCLKQSSIGQEKTTSLSGQIDDMPSSSMHSTSVNESRFGAGHPNHSLVGALPDRSTRVAIEFTDGSHLYFNDQRKFGWMKLFPSVEVPNIDFMAKVGPEPLEDSFTAAVFIPRIRRRNNTTIKAAILDQTVLAGVGNIYADESLWGAKLHPSTRVRDVGDEKLATLLDEIKYVMTLSIEKGGSTDKNYVDAEGKRGSYLSFARVFRREGRECPRCGSVIIKLRVAGRGTHICPDCQMEVV